MSKIVGISMSSEIVNLLNKELTTVLVSTVTAEGFPHSMPVHLLAALDDSTVRMALMKSHQTVVNIKDNGNTFISILEGSDVAVGIKCTAKVIREPMKGNSAMCMVEFKVQEIKSDTTPTVIVTDGVRTKHRSPKTADFFRVMFDELYEVVGSLT